MNEENDSIIQIAKTTGDFCKAYKDLGTSVDALGTKIYDLESRINNIKTKYNITETEEEYMNAQYVYNNLSDTEKVKDDNGMVVPFERLTQEEIDAFEKEANNRKNSQYAMQEELAKYNRQVKELNVEYERALLKNANLFRRKIDLIENEVTNVKATIKRIGAEKEAYECNIRRTETDTNLTNKGVIITEYRKQIRVCDIRLAVMNTIQKSADLYLSVAKAISNHITTSMYNEVDYVEMHNGLETELSIAEEIQVLATSFNKFKSDYADDLNKVNELEERVKEFDKNRYSGLQNAEEFVKRAKNSLKSIRSTINKIGESKDINKENEYIENLDLEQVVETVEPEVEEIPEVLETEEVADTVEPTVNVEKAAEPTADSQEEKKEESVESVEDEKVEEAENKEEAKEAETQEKKEEADVKAESQEVVQNTNAEPSVNQTKLKIDDIAMEVVKVKSRKNTNLSRGEKVLLVAGVGVGLLTGSILPMLPTLGVTAVDEYIKAKAKLKEASVTHKFNKIARKTTKELRKSLNNDDIKMKLVKMEDESGNLTGELRYVISNGETEIATLGNDTSNVNGYDLSSVTEYVTEQLNDEFAYMNDPELRKKREHYDKYGYPRVDLENLEVAYAEFGGIKYISDIKKFSQLHLSRIGAVKAINDLGHSVLNNIHDSLTRTSGDVDDYDDAIDAEIKNEEVVNESEELMNELDNDENDKAKDAEIKNEEIVNKSEELMNELDNDENVKEQSDEEKINGGIFNKLINDGIDEEDVYGYMDKINNVREINPEMYNKILNGIIFDSIKTSTELDDLINPILGYDESLEDEKGFGRV